MNIFKYVEKHKEDRNVEYGSMKEAALDYVHYGIPVFPLTVRKDPPNAHGIQDKPRKVPLTGMGGFKKSTLAKSQVESW